MNLIYIICILKRKEITTCKKKKKRKKSEFKMLKMNKFKNDLFNLSIKLIYLERKKKFTIKKGRKKCKYKFIKKRHTSFLKKIIICYTPYKSLILNFIIFIFYT
ncbi:hypothetical protein RhiirC2_279527 [Rhizophagus irregularis]|uniref:Uncharacterized protein n=2 Tax=Rhizophagus irregularis TaxID=588596 RepID=A0A2N1MDR6_9GLOM|nr:hypothetical protein RhiirC2_279527 [Rhizophagus irregularis]